jgi:hypothetical protein
MSRYASLALIVAILAVIALAVALLPSGYDTDVSQVGQGRPAVVLVHDHGLVQSMELMAAVDAVRNEFEPETLIIVANPHHPAGEAFVEAHALPPVALVLFDAEGRIVDRFAGSPDPASVRRFLAQIE